MAMAQSQRWAPCWAAFIETRVPRAFAYLRSASCFGRIGGQAEAEACPGISLWAKKGLHVGRGIAVEGLGESQGPDSNNSNSTLFHLLSESEVPGPGLRLDRITEALGVGPGFVCPLLKMI